MMTTTATHTPAPWTLEPPSVIGHADVRFGVKGQYDGCAIIVANVGKYDIADANAKLVAAAPDLLAALKHVQFGFNHRRCMACAGWNMSPNGETDNVHTADCPVFLAIEKAEGRL